MLQHEGIVQREMWAMPSSEKDVKSPGVSVECESLCHDPAHAKCQLEALRGGRGGGTHMQEALLGRWSYSPARIALNDSTVFLSGTRAPVEGGKEKASQSGLQRPSRRRVGIFA